MDCDVNHIPTVGIMGRIMHMSASQANALFEQYGLKMGQAGILFMLQRYGEVSQRDLASHMRVTPPSITAAIQKMEKLELIKRKPDDKDQRIMRLSLTEKGIACLKHAKGVAEHMDDVMFKGMSPEERLLFRRLLIQVSDNLKEDKEFKKFSDVPPWNGPPPFHDKGKRRDW
ncbi:MAG: MarR family transcriptional regulator [Muricomes sp.]